MEGNKISGYNNDEFENGSYWTDGKDVYFFHTKISGADVDSFLQYAGPWATDKNYCYCASFRLENADRETFNVLNRIFAKDKFNVWTGDGKKVKGLDAESFEIFGDRDSVSPFVFCKDRNHVYYYFYGIKIIKKALVESFIPINREFGIDKNNVFWHEKKLNGANSKTWKLLKEDYHYSKDKYIYFCDRIIKKADIETFEVIEGVELYHSKINYAKDKNRYYFNSKIISKDEFEKNRIMKR